MTKHTMSTGMDSLHMQMEMDLTIGTEMNLKE